MSEVKRYDYGTRDEGLVESDRGDYVLASDYFALEASITAREREACLWGWQRSESSWDQIMAEAARRYPGKEATK